MSWRLGVVYSYTRLDGFVAVRVAVCVAVCFAVGVAPRVVAPWCSLLVHPPRRMCWSACCSVRCSVFCSMCCSMCYSVCGSVSWSVSWSVCSSVHPPRRMHGAYSRVSTHVCVHNMCMQRISKASGCWWTRRLRSPIQDVMLWGGWLRSVGSIKL